MDVLPFDCIVSVLEYLSPLDLSRVALVNQTFFEATKIDYLWRAHALQQWTFCDISQVEEGPGRWRRYFYARARIDANIDQGRPGFDYRARTLRGPDSVVTQLCFVQGDVVNWEKPLLPLLVSCYEDGTIKAWDANKGLCVWTAEAGGVCSSAAVHPEASDLAVGVSGGRVLIYDTSQWKEKTSFSTGEGTVPCKICYLAERKGKETTWFLLVGIDSGDVQVWECPSYTRLGVLRGSALVGLLTAMEISKVGLVAVTGSRGDVAIWLVSLLKRDFAEQENPLPHVSLNRGRAPILLFDDPFFEELDDIPVPRERRLPPLFAVNAPRRMQWLPSRAGTLAVASGGVIELWGLADKLEECRKNYKTWRAPDDGYKVVDPTQVLNLGAHVHCLVSSGEYLVTGDAAGCVQVWDVAKGVCTQQFRDHKGAVTGLFGDAFRMVSCSTDYSLRVYRWKKEERRLPTLESRYTLLGGSVAMKKHSGFSAVQCSLNCCVGVAGSGVKVYTFGT